jgi:hypothetical protein
LQAIGPWPRARQLEDWRYDAQAGARGVRLAYVDDFVAETRNHGEGRLCHLWKSDRAAMQDRIEAFLRVHEYARQAGVPADAPERARFARTLFWMSRQAGARGFAREARELFDLSLEYTPSPRWDQRAYRASSRLLGWRLSGRLAETLDRWRR